MLQDAAPVPDPKSAGFRVKALLIDLSRKFGGASSRALTLVRNFPPGQVGLAVLKDSPIALEACRLGLPVIIVGSHKLSPFILFRLISAIRRVGYHVLDTQNPQSKFWGSLAGWLTGTPLVSTLNSWYIDEHGKMNLRGLFYALLELGTNFALVRYIVVSKSIFDGLVRYRIDPSKIHLIYNAIDIIGDNISSLRPSLIEKLKIPTDSILIVAAGRFVWAKGYEDLVDAVQLLAPENPNVYCLIAGDGELYSKLEKRIETAGLKERIMLLGQTSRADVLSLVKACDIFTMSSRSEGTPMVLLEAASLKKPILATNVGGIPELLKSEEDCLLVPAGNPPALANGMKRMLADKKFSERLALSAYLRVIQNFSVEGQVRDTMSVYSQAWLDHGSK